MLLQAHSGVRYLVLLAGVLTLGYALLGLATRRPFHPRMRVFGSLFAATLDLNVLLGVMVLVFGQNFYPALSGHILMMVLAAVVGHVVPAVMRRRPSAERTWAPYAVGTAVALAMIAMGILAIGRPIVG